MRSAPSSGVAMWHAPDREPKVPVRLGGEAYRRIMADPSQHPVSRRGVLRLGAAGTMAAVGGFALWGCTPEQAGMPSPISRAPTPSASPRLPTGAVGTLREPDVFASSNGRLDLELTAALTNTVVAGSAVRALTYNGGLPGPTLRVRPGDGIALRLRNDLAAPTNLHLHGLVVSPEGAGDNVFVMIEPGGAHEYEYRLGYDHPLGTFWYHPHYHGHAAEQLFGGLYGVIIVAEESPIESVRERLLVVSDIAFDARAGVHAASPVERMLGREGDLVMVNGQVGAVLAAGSGERERWRLVNACSSRFLRLRLDGQRMQLLGIDAGRYTEPRDVEEFVLAPGNPPTSW